MYQELVNASEAGRRLGVSPATVIRWFDNGHFPNGFRVESTVRIPVSDIEALKQNRPEAS